MTQVIERDLFGRVVSTHYDDATIALAKKRDIDPAWIDANCTRGKGGWNITGFGDGEQFMPDNPYTDPKTGKTIKYKSPAGYKPGLFIPSPPEGKPGVAELATKLGYIVITEGHFKAIKAVSEGIPCVSISGIYNGRTKLGTDGELVLIEFLQKYIKGRFRSWITAFDADVATNPHVGKASIELGELMTEAGATVKIATGQWTVDEGKGMDDFISKNGADEMRRRLGQALSLDEYREQFEDREDKPTRSAVTPADVGLDLADSLSGQLLFDPGMQRWWRYGVNSDGVWADVTDTEVSSHVLSQVMLRLKPSQFKNPSFISGATEIMKLRLLESKWHGHSDGCSIPFKNGVLDVESKALTEHSPSNRLTWSLPREYDPSQTDWGFIQQFLLESLEGRQDDIDILNCFAAAVLRKKSKLQKYLHLRGNPGSGKGTFTNLLVGLVGKENIRMTDVSAFCSNQFDAAGAYGKRLLMFPDQQPHSGNIGAFLNATGGEYIRYERKGKDPSQFIFDGLTLVTSNDPVFTGGNLRAIQRRQIMVMFDNMPASPDPTLLDRLTTQLPAWTNHLLSIPDSEIERVLSQRTERGKLLDWDTYCLSNSLASWMNDHIVKSPESHTRMGADKSEMDSVGSLWGCSTLYGSYCGYCKQTNQSPLAVKSFSPALLSILTQTLKWGTEKEMKGRDKKGMIINKIRLRAEDDDALTISESLSLGVGCGVGLVQDAVYSQNPYTASPVQGCRIKPQLLPDSENEVEKTEKDGDFSNLAGTTLLSCIPTPPLPSKDSILHQTLHQSCTNPTPEDDDGLLPEHTEAKVGDTIVTLVCAYGIPVGTELEVTELKGGHTVCKYIRKEKGKKEVIKTPSYRPHLYRVKARG